MTFTVREATPDDCLGVRRVLDAAMLEIRDDLGERIEAGDVLVAETADDRPVLGALVLVPRERARVAVADGESADGAAGSESADGERGAHVDAVAVRRARRGRGIGSALVRTAAERQPRLTAEFDPGVRDFYESLGFEIEAGDDGRLRGRYGFESDGERAISAWSQTPTRRVRSGPKIELPIFEYSGMDDTKRRRLAVVWVAFAVVIAYVTLADGFTAEIGDLLGLLVAVLGLGLAYVYYANPNEILDFGE